MKLRIGVMTLGFVVAVGAMAAMWIVGDPDRDQRTTFDWLMLIPAILGTALVGLGGLFWPMFFPAQQQLPQRRDP